MFIPIAIGVLCSAAAAPLVNRDYMRRAAKYGGKPPAEIRLIPMMISCWFIPAGLFPWAWSSYPELSWAGPCISGWAVGFGFIFLYNAANNYLGRLSISLRNTPKLTCCSRFIPASCGISTGSEDILALLLGCGCGPLYRADVSPVGRPMGWHTSGVHIASLLWHSLRLLLLRSQDPSKVPLRICWR